MTEDTSPENLRKFLENDDSSMRRMGISLTKGAGVEELYKNVFGLSLWDPEEGNREAARELVEEIGLENITEFPGWLEPFEEGEVDVVVRKAAVATLGKIGDERAVEPLIGVLSDDDWRVRWSAAEALGKIGDERAVEPLIEVLSYDDGDENVHEAAAEALGEIGDERTVEPLIGMLSDDNSRVRRNAAGALDKLGWVPETDRQRAVYLIAVEDWKSVVECGESAVNALIGALPFWWMTKAAAEALGEIGKPAVEPLIRILSDNDERVRRSAADALGEIGDVRAVEPLIKVLGDDSWRVRWPAVEALGKIGDERAVEPLITALEDEDDDVRNAAEEALEKLGHEVE